MSYQEQYNKLLDAFKNNKSIFHEGIELKFYSENFISNNGKINCYEHQLFDTGYLVNVLMNYYLNQNSNSKKYIFPCVCNNTEFFDCNNSFTYKVFHPVKNEKANDVIILLHGLNERDWNKYLTWAEMLYRKTKKTVIMFPLAFHMDRAPVEWGDSRLMNEISKERKSLFIDLKFSSYANAALSTRMNFEPERLFLSGIQSFLDIIQLIEEIKEDKNKFIDKDAKIDILGYSMGAFLGELLLMVNHKNYFSNSKLLLFCGGSVLEETFPTSKAILDSESVTLLKDYYTTGFEEKINKNGNNRKIIKEFSEIVVAFKSLLTLNQSEKTRDLLLKNIEDRLLIVGLQKDTVFPIKGIKETFRLINPDKIKIIDFDYHYTHEKMFFEKGNFDDKVSIAFNTFADLVSNFYNGSN